MKNNKTYMIFYDRGYRAQDNGEHLCRGVMKHHPEIHAAYILNKSSYDGDRLHKEGFNLIDAQDKGVTHRELMSCEYACSSIFNESINLDFSKCTCKRVFLNHGCFLAPISYLKGEHDNIDLFIAANKTEYDTMLDPYHEIKREQVALCGQPRQDELVNMQKAPHVEDSILIQFWQRPQAGTKDDNKKFLESDFYKKTSQLLSSKKLLSTCRAHGIKIVGKMHSIQYDGMKYYSKYANDVVRLSPLSEPFEQEFIRSKMIVTDISSNAYEMAKIGKPCLYFEPDEEELFKGRLKKNGGFEFDLNYNSIGPIVKDSVTKAVNEICKMIESNYKLEEKFIKRRNECISFSNDAHNCERCFNAIMNIKTSKTEKKTKAAEYEAKKKKASSGYYLYF